MKQASSATQAILAAGQYKRADFYDITLAGNVQDMFFTNSDMPLKIGTQLYLTGLSLARNELRQEVGMQVQSMTVTVTPQDDATNAPILLNGYRFLEGCKRKQLDGARILFSKGFYNDFKDTSPGIVPFFQGRVNKVSVDRFSARITINSDIEMLNVQMPRNVYQPGCVHTLFDAGCGLSASSFQIGGTVQAGSTVLSVLTNLTQADDYFTLGRITFTSGTLAGVSRTVKLYAHTGGAISMPYPLPGVPETGANFIVLPGCDKTIATCTTKFNNFLRIRLYPFIPVPETLYDGGNIIQSSRQDFGGQGGAKTGSALGGASASKTYKA